MRDNYTALKREFDLYGPRWKERAKAMAEVGLKDWDGKEPTMRGAQATWYRVVRDMEGKPRNTSGKGSKGAEPRPGSDPPAAVPTSPGAKRNTAAPEPPQDWRDDDEEEFGPIKGFLGPRINEDDG
jgi:hypothetical protein